MTSADLRPAQMDHAPVLSSDNLGWENILVKQFQPPAGEAFCHFPEEHTICLSLSSRPVQFLQIKGSKRFTGLYGKGDISITPAGVPVFARWQQADHFLEIRLPSQFLQTVAYETLGSAAVRLELVDDFRIRDAQLEAIAQLLLTDLQQQSLGGKLYIDSLTNVLAVHLIRHYAATTAQISEYEGGLSQQQLLQVLDYLNDHLDQEIKLADLANLLGISQFHFSRLFKQSVGLSPYQYLLQQRIETAKRLLKQTDDSIMEIALSCGFNSHSHLTQQFRKLTGITPSRYRSDR
ncbi:helix-turn-helix domain-containing protein [Thermoleptolyngbya sp. M55_K2018_002]|uniref:helix-turn-helix domain-containing protein n=1 Tax=Thermoleptolyngbya sp. M55_K2018_002 TaxID=2747808 RepID=UPI0019DEC72D|nr:AraC family transcriptional regulator [Thermoleptolyngbya sp. M55_K2018_002]HIK39474.1 helix-turn-helix transcriptional regulator [Thermoleptolyngbya sp. M55_K2018_002]